MEFINCHIHTFTVNHVPNRFLPAPVMGLFKFKPIRKPLIWSLKNIFPFSKRDYLHRYMNFLEITANKTQEATFETVKDYYPNNTKFIILPMDMKFMGAGKLKVDLEGQLEELLVLYKQYPKIIFPFIAVDPRRENILDLVKEYIEKHNFKGIKIYPSLGFYPSDPRLKSIYKYAEDNKIPILSHCSKGGVYTHKITPEMLNHPIQGKITKDKPKKFASYFTDPRNYRTVLEEFPKLKLCLAHFGGNSSWDEYLEKPWNPEKMKESQKSWVSVILEMIEEYPNLYTDISYTMFHTDRYFPFLNILLEKEKVKNKVMFGSDYYMVERVKTSEREMSLKVRNALGEKKFKMIALDNINSYLSI